MEAREKSLADSLLAWALDHEALYTILDTIKPISSIKLYRFPLLDSPSKRNKAIREVDELTILLRKMSTPQLTFLLNPFRVTDSVNKVMEVYVIRNQQMARKIQEQQSFYATLGITPATSPATVMSITEYENKYHRWQSYGYLFGYPSYAVDFFTQAGKQQDSTGKFVSRDFFAIPVQAAATGHFTYAIPKGHITGELDSALYRQAMNTLQFYKKLRSGYLKGGRLDAGSLLLAPAMKSKRKLL